MTPLCAQTGDEISTSEQTAQLVFSTLPVSINMRMHTNSRFALELNH
jgi:hypothetical protein